MEVAEREDFRWGVSCHTADPHNGPLIILATPKISPNYSHNLKNSTIIPSEILKYFPYFLSIL